MFNNGMSLSWFTTSFSVVKTYYFFWLKKNNQFYNLILCIVYKQSVFFWFFVRVFFCLFFFPSGISSGADLVIHLSRSGFCTMKIRVLLFCVFVFFLHLFFHGSFSINILDKSLYLTSKLDFLVNTGSLPFQ